MDVQLAGRCPDHAVVAVAGDLDLATSNQLLVSLRRLVHAHDRAIRLDLSGVTFLDSAGPRSLLAPARYATGLDRTSCLARGARIAPSADSSLTCPRRRP